MNEILEKISNVTKVASEKAKQAATVVSEKTNQVSEIAKLNGKITMSEHTISTNYTILGKYYYDTYKDNPDDGASEAVNNITAALDSIEEMKAQILSIKGAVKCKNCGAECPVDFNFCSKCGTELEKPEPPVEEEEAVSPEAIEVVSKEEADENAGE